MPSENDKEIENVVNLILNELAEVIFSKSQDNLVEYEAVDTGHMLGSGIVEHGNEPIINYSAPYSSIIEYGRHPGSYPPFTPIFKWVKRRLGIKKDKEAKKIAWAIMNKIKTHGIDGRPFMSSAIYWAENQTLNVSFDHNIKTRF